MTFASILPILISIVKWIIQRDQAGKLSDKQFIEFILAHDKQRSRAGKSAVEFDQALKEAQEEMNKWRLENE